MKHRILTAELVLAGTAAAVSSQAQDMASSMTLVSLGRCLPGQSGQCICNSVFGNEPGRGGDLG